MNDDTWVHDARNGNFTGPFSPEDAKALVERLNRKVLQETVPALADVVTEVTGPFYLQPVGHRVY